MAGPAHAPHPGQPMRRGRGFTLIEVLVALGIVAIMAVLSWRGIDTMARGQQAVAIYTDEVLALQAGLSQWRADLDAIVSWDTGARPGTATAGPAAVQSLLWDGRLLRLSRQDSAGSAVGLRVVAWLRRPADGQWLRWQSGPVQSLQAWQAAWDAAARWGESDGRASSSGAGEAVAVARVLDWQLHYFRRNAWTHPLSSQAEASETTSAVPDGIRLFLTLAPDQALGGAMQIDWVRPDFGGRRP